MHQEEQAVSDRLLKAARAEFSEHGYEKASLRKICARAGVTTGALYFFFQNKEDLFEHVVGNVVRSMERLTDEMIEEELRDSSVGVDNEKKFLEFMWKNQEVVRILMEKSAGTKYEDYGEKMVQGLEGIYARFFQKFGEVPDRALIHALVKMKTQGYMELITGGYSLERILKLAEMLGWYTEAGFEGLTEKLNQRM